MEWLFYLYYRNCALARGTARAAPGADLEEDRPLAKSDRSCQKSRYIPKRLVAKAERMNREKVAVREILEVLGVKG